MNGTTNAPLSKFVANTVERYRASGRRYHRDLRLIHQNSRPLKESLV